MNDKDVKHDAAELGNVTSIKQRLSAARRDGISARIKRPECRLQIIEQRPNYKEPSDIAAGSGMKSPKGCESLGCDARALDWILDVIDDLKDYCDENELKTASVLMQFLKADIKIGPLK